ncbi:MAG: glycosyltransferase [Nodosilinea sp.]
MDAQINRLLLLLISVFGFFGLYMLQNPGHLASWDIFGLISLGFIGIWRWSWFAVRMIRAKFYLYGLFPRWRRAANAVPVEHLPHMCFLVPTYREQPWISERVFQAIAREAKTLAQPITVLVSSSSDDENKAISQILEQADPGLRSIRLIQMTQKDGKRKAMADGLRELALHDLPDDTVIALMDGDSELGQGVLRQCLPFFRLFPKIGALTTDEIPIVEGSSLFSEWFHLRFAQRHSQMCSDALSRKVMCLTGRFSLFQANLALQPSFIAQLENDSLQDWLWGQFKFLSGDDKSTWFWLLRRKFDMLYVPDALVYSIETVSGSIVDRAYNNMRRWYGNMLRNSSRAIALGPKTTGWFIWYSLLDQRFNFWTCLITPSFLLVSLCTGQWLSAGVVTAWILLTRPLMLMLIFWGRKSHLKLVHLPLLLFHQWGASLVKIWTQMNLAQQNWSNRGNQSISAAGTGIRKVVKQGTSRLLLFSQLFFFGIILCSLAGILNPIWDIAGLQLAHQDRQSDQPIRIVDAIDYGIWPDDNQDDAIALQTLIAELPAQQAVTIQLPIGQFDWLQPITINRSNLTIRGYGLQRTVIQTYDEQLDFNALLQVESTQSAAAKPVQVYGVTLRSPTNQEFKVSVIDVPGAE